MFLRIRAEMPGLMDWVKLSSRYYLDPSVAGLPDADTEVLFTRSLAYAGDQETGGFIPSNIVLTLCRRRRYEACVEALIAHSLWLPASGGYQINRWQEWQEELEAIVRRRSADRDRKRRERARGKPQVNGMSRDMSEDSPRDRPAHIEKGRGEKKISSAEVGNQSSVRNARATDDPVIQAIQQTIYDVTDRPVDALWAGRIRALISGLAKDDDLGPAYFEKVIRNEQDPVRRFLEHDPPPPWCGECSPNRRLEDPETGSDAGRCPKCHPSLRKEPA